MPLPRLSALFLMSALTLPAQVPALDPAGLTQTLKSGKWVVIEFGGPTCIPCKHMQPILADLQKQFGDRALVRNVYVTQYAKETKPYKIMVMPTQVVFDPSGKEVARHLGFWDKAEFVATLAKAGLK